MQIDKAIIEKFLNNRCNAEEAKQVHRYLQEHPEILQEWFQHDWNQAAEEGPVNSYFAADMYRNIDESIHAQKTGLLRIMLLAAAAAAVILVAFSIWMYLPEQKVKGTVEQVAAAQKKKRRCSFRKSHGNSIRTIQAASKKIKAARWIKCVAGSVSHPEIQAGIR